MKYYNGREGMGVWLSLPTRGAWIEILWAKNKANCDASLPTRGAWIEIPLRPVC